MLSREDWSISTAPRLQLDPRRGRCKQPREAEQGQSFTGGEVYLSFPGLGDRLAARVAGEIGDHPSPFESPNALQRYAGNAPVTRPPGRSKFVISCRLAYNRHLGDAVQSWAFCSLRSSPWAREFYDAKRAKRPGHHAALRALRKRWLELLWHCLQRGLLYDETIHAANRNRAVQPLTEAA